MTSSRQPHAQPDDPAGARGPVGSVPVTHGELVDAARLCAARAQRTLARTAFADAEAARYVLAARARLLTAIAHHGEVTLGAGVVQAWRDSAPAPRGVEERDPRVRAALAWLDTLTGSTGPDSDQPPVPASGRPVAGVHLDRARALVAAASDLIATHRDPNSVLRPTASPNLGVVDAVSLLAAPARLAALAAPVEPLALRCRQAGMPAAAIDAALPLGDPITVASWDLAAALRFPTSAVAPITVHAAGVDTSSPATEWGSRLNRIASRLRAREAHGRISVRTLHDLATLGLVTSHILTTHTHLSTGETPPPAGLGRVTEQWRALAGHLAPLRSTQPADRVIHADVDRLLTIAHPGTATHRGAATSPGMTIDPVARAGLVAAMRVGLPTLDACAAVADRLLAASTDAWIPATARRPYLPDLHRPGRAARPAPPAPTGFPRMGPTLA